VNCILRVFLFAGPGYEEKLKEEHLQKQRDAVEARAKLSEFERLVDPNNKEMMDMLAEMRTHTVSLERQAAQKEPTIFHDPESEKRVELNAKDARGFYIP